MPCMHVISSYAVVQTNPVITKALTSTGGFIVGDTLAQMATGGSEEYDWCASSHSNEANSCCSKQT
jgi:hypothetical protein